MITETNTGAKVVLKERELVGKYVADILDLGKGAIDEILNQYGLNAHHEIRLKDHQAVYNLRIIPLQTVSLASRGYMIVLTDISLLVQQREMLQHQVKKAFF